MRARNIKPGFFKNEYLAACGAEAMICFAGLWCMADRRGILEDRPLRIKAELFPYFNWNPFDILDKLNKAGFILRYEQEGQKLIYIPKFLNHQNPVKHESKSEFPAPNDTSTEQVQNKYRTSIEQVGLIPDSFNLIPDILIPDSKNSCSKKPSLDPDFEKFWEAYPVKRGKPPASKAWNKSKGKRPPITEIISNLKALCESDSQWSDPKYIPYPATWLNREGWNERSISGNTKQNNGRGRAGHAEPTPIDREYAEKKHAELRRYLEADGMEKGNATQAKTSDDADTATNG